MPDDDATPGTFARQLEGALSLLGWTGRELADRIASELASEGLGKTNDVQVSRWRNGHTEPSLAVQGVILRWLSSHLSPAAVAPRKKARVQSVLSPHGGVFVAGKNDRYVVKTEDGQWAVKKANADRASAVEPTQAKAEARAKEIVKNLGGGEVRIQGARTPGFRDSDTVKRGNDPNPPKDKKH